MKKPPHQLEKDLVKAALEFHALGPWNEIAWNAIFLVRVPGEDMPLVAAVMGSGGEEHGLMLVRGENAMTLLAAVALDSPEADNFGQEGDLLSVSFGAWGTVSDTFRVLLERAGQKPRRDKQVPVIFRSRPGEDSHSPGRTDMRMLLLVLRAFNAALSEGAMQPQALDPGVQRILELSVESAGRKVNYATREVDWPEASIEAPALMMLPGDLKDLPRLQERWTLLRIRLPGDLGEIDGIDSDQPARALLLAVENGPIIAFHVTGEADLSEAADLLTETMRGQGASEHEAGLPGAILFDDFRLHAALAPALAGLGIETEADPESEVIAALLEAIDEALPELDVEPDPDPEPGSLDFWKAAEFETSRLLSVEVMAKKLITPRAMKRHYGDVEVGERVLETFEQFSAHIALIEWLAADYRATSRSKTLIEKLLAKPRKFGPQMRALLEARQDARLSVFHVKSCEPGLLLEVEDIFDGECFTVHDRALSSCGLEGIFLPLRLIEAGDWIFPLFAGPPLKAMQLYPALHAVMGPDADIDSRAIKQQPEIVSYLWSWLLHERTPILQNTDGELLENQNATFRIANGDRLIKKLDANPDLDFDEQAGTWVWGREQVKGSTVSRTVLGRLTILDDRLLLEVNSAERLARARTWLQATGELTFESGTSSAFLSEDRPLDDRLPDPHPDAPTPEMIDALKSTMLEHYKRWVDEPVPMLGDLTPRQACKTAKGKRQVQRMIRTMPPIETPDGPIEAPRAEILADLGIDASGG